MGTMGEGGRGRGSGGEEAAVSSGGLWAMRPVLRCVSFVMTAITSEGNTVAVERIR